MSRAWIFQANPDSFDIDAALEQLTQISWRVPQHTADIHRGDVVMLWRSGPDAGFVGIGRVVSEPKELEPGPAERVFARGAEENPVPATRAPIEVRPVPFVSKGMVRDLDGMRDHAIITGPMGTVFALADEQWDQIQTVVPAPPGLEVAEPQPPLPPVFAWPQRLKAVLPMPGGYAGYLDAVGRICELVEAERPTPEEFVHVLEQEFGLGNRGAYLRAIFLRRVGFVLEEGGVCRTSDWAQRWFASRDPKIAIALVHGRTRFVGEMLTVVREPKTVEEILHIANESYGAGWKTSTQVNNRRGWLQSAGMLRIDDAGRLVLTDAGDSFLRGVPIFEPGEPVEGGQPAVAVAIQPEAQAATDGEPPAVAVPAGVDQLIHELNVSATASSDPNRFERAIRDVFEFLGFNAQWLGGAGRTDVLLTAALGRGPSYRVVVDAKSSGAGTVGDQQIDWVTLQDHKSKHDADFVALVAPSPHGSRLFNRASQQGVAVISVERLSALCHQHASAPLGLDVYRDLFTTGGELDLQAVAERADEWLRIVGLATAIVRAIRERSQQFGPLSARDLFLILADDPAGEAATEDELQQLLETLASPFIGLLSGTAASGYLVTTSREVLALRLGLLAVEVGRGG